MTTLLWNTVFPNEVSILSIWEQQQMQMGLFSFYRP